MKKFLKPTKFKIIICLISSLLFYLAMNFVRQFEPVNELGEILRMAVYIYTYIIYIIPLMIITEIRGAFDFVNWATSEDGGIPYSSLAYRTIIILYNFALTYFIVSWIEWRGDKRREKNI